MTRYPTRLCAGGGKPSNRNLRISTTGSVRIGGYQPQTGERRPDLNVFGRVLTRIVTQKQRIDQRRALGISLEHLLDCLTPLTVRCDEATSYEHFETRAETRRRLATVGPQR